MRHRSVSPLPQCNGLVYINNTICFCVQTHVLGHRISVSKNILMNLGGLKHDTSNATNIIPHAKLFGEFRAVETVESGNSLIHVSYPTSMEVYYLYFSWTKA